MVNELIEKNHNQWYSQYKRLTNQGKTDAIVVEEISHLSDIEQAEKIAAILLNTLQLLWLILLILG